MTRFSHKKPLFINTQKIDDMIRHWQQMKDACRQLKKPGVFMDEHCKFFMAEEPEEPLPALGPDAAKEEEAASLARRAKGEPGHKQVWLEREPRCAAVDEGLVPFILALWKAGIDTYGSCQEAKPGLAWVQFPTAHDAVKFLNLVIGVPTEAGVHDDRSIYNRLLNREIEGGWQLAVHPHDYGGPKFTASSERVVSEAHRPSHIDFLVSVHFPRTDLATLVSLLEAAFPAADAFPSAGGPSEERSTGQDHSSDALLAEIDAARGKKMVVPVFPFPDGKVGFLECTCRGLGMLVGYEAPSEFAVGLYTATGQYFNLLVDRNVECELPTFLIEDKPYHFPILQYRIMYGGLSVIDPATGNMIGQKEGTKAADNRQKGGPSSLSAV